MTDKLTEIKKALEDSLGWIVTGHDEYQQVEKALIIITELQEQQAVDVDGLKKDVFNAVEGNPYVHGVDALACAGFVIDYLASKNLLRGVKE